MDMEIGKALQAMGERIIAVPSGVMLGGLAALHRTSPNGRSGCHVVAQMATCCKRVGIRIAHTFMMGLMPGAEVPRLKRKR